MGSLFKKPKMPPAPKPVALPEYKPPPAPEPVPAMPIADDAVIGNEKKKQLLKKSVQSGRASTFLSDDESGLG